MPTPETVLPSADGGAGILPFTYAWVSKERVPVYASPQDGMLGAKPVRYLKPGFVWVSLLSPQPDPAGGKLWYAINPGEYVEASVLKIFSPSAFQGRMFSEPPSGPFGWLILDTIVRDGPGEAIKADSPTIPQYTLVHVLEIEKIGKRDWYRIGDGQWVEQRWVAVVWPASRPSRVGPNDRWISVNLFEQTLAAYEGDRMVYATLVSSGQARWPTVEGLFRVWAKVAFAKMSGGSEAGGDYYFLEDVPWQVYFFQSYALHGAYWHDNFGIRQSHGCVNLAPKDAQWIFDWTSPPAAGDRWTLATRNDPGTWVWIHE